REIDWFERGRNVLVAGEGIAGMRIGKLRDRTKISCCNLRGVLLSFPALDDQLPKTLIGFGLDVKEVAVRFERAAIDAEGRDRANLGCRRFENENGAIVAKGFSIFRCC